MAGWPEKMRRLALEVSGCRGASMSTPGVVREEERRNGKIWSIFSQGGQGGGQKGGEDEG